MNAESPLTPAASPAGAPAPIAEAAPLLKVTGLTKTFAASGGLRKRTAEVKALADVSFTIERGKTLGLVGESGSGKSTAATCVLRLQDSDAGVVELDGEDVLKASRSRLRKLRARMQIVFQDPYGSLDPRFSIRALIEEPLLVHGVKDPAERRARALEMLERVGLRPELAERNAHAFSGGQRQRIAIARALVLNPDLVVLDEPVTALDVSVQAQVLNLLRELQKTFDLTYLFIVHDLAVAKHICDRIAVMYRGEIVEIADSEALFASPQHPYTVSLLLAAPVPDPELMQTARSTLGQLIDDPSAATPTGCPLRARCPIGHDRPLCGEVAPKLTQVGPGHEAACHFPGEMAWGEPEGKEMP